MLSLLRYIRHNTTPTQTITYTLLNLLPRDIQWMIISRYPTTHYRLLLGVGLNIPIPVDSSSAELSIIVKKQKYRAFCPECYRHACTDHNYSSVWTLRQIAMYEMQRPPLQCEYQLINSILAAGINPITPHVLGVIIDNNRYDLIYNLFRYELLPKEELWVLAMIYNKPYLNITIVDDWLCGEFSVYDKFYQQWRETKYISYRQARRQCLWIWIRLVIGRILFGPLITGLSIIGGIVVGHCLCLLIDFIKYTYVVANNRPQHPITNITHSGMFDEKFLEFR